VSLLRRSALLFAAQIVSLVLTFAASILIARALGPDGRGVLALVGVLSDMVIWFVTLGLGSAYQVLAGKGDVPRAALAGNCLLLSLALGGVAALGVFAAAPWLLASAFRGLTVRQLGLAAAALPFGALTFLTSNLLIGAGLVRAQAGLQVGSAAFSAAAAAIVLYGFGLGVDAMVVLLVVTAALVAAAHVAVLAGAWGLSFRGAAGIAREALAYGLRAYVGTVTSYVWLRADVVILNWFAGPRAVGWYSLAGGLAEKLWLLDSSVGRAVLPRVIGADRAGAADLAGRAARHLLLVTGLAAAALAILSPWLIPAIYGEAFRPSVLPFVLLLPGIAAQAASRPLAAYFYGQLARPLVVSATSAATMVLALAVYLALIPPFGIAGAAIGTTAAYLLPLAAYVALFARATGTPARRALLVERGDLALYRTAAARLFHGGAGSAERGVARRRT
jgi:O-antigen/teichoic acid export membrane protein